MKQCKNPFRKKVVDLNDKNNIAQLSEDIKSIQGLNKSLVKPIQEGIYVLKNYEETHELEIEQIRQIYHNLNISEQMTPEEMEHSLQRSGGNVAILEKKYLKTTLDKEEFSILIENILGHFSSIVEQNILDAITKIIENFSCLCLTSKSDFSYKDVCFKFFTRNPKSDHVLVLILNIHYQQFSLSYKILNMCKMSKQKMSLNFLGALVKTDLP